MGNITNSTFQDNEIVKSEDLNYIGESQFSNIALLVKHLIASDYSLVIEGLEVQERTTPSMNVDLSSGLGYNVSDETITHNGALKGPVPLSASDPTNDRIDIVQIRKTEDTFDNQQRAFKNPLSGIVTFSNMDVKNSMITEISIKTGTPAASPVAPTVDSGWVKIAEILVAANVTEIYNADIYNITADKPGVANTNWTTETSATYKIQSLDSFFATFRQSHESDGSHSAGTIKADDIDFGVGTNQVDADIVPLGTTVNNNPTGGTTTTLLGSSFVRAALQEIFDRLKDLSGVGNDAVKNRHIDFGTGSTQIKASDIPILDSAGDFDSSQLEAVIKEIWDKYDAVFNNEKRAGSIIQPASTIHFPFFHPSLANSNQDLPISNSKIKYLDYNDSNTKFSDRGVMYCESGGHLMFNASFISDWNSITIKMRIKPNWSYDGAYNTFLIDSRQFNSDTENFFIFYYQASNDSFTLQVSDDSTNYIVVRSSAFTNNNDLQVFHDIVIVIDKNNNDDADNKGNAKFYLNGVNQTDRTKLNNGIANLALNPSFITFFRPSSDYANFANADYATSLYFLDWLFKDSWDDTTTNYDGTGSVKPYYNDNWLPILNHNGILKGDGDAGFKSLQTESLNIGGGYKKEFRAPLDGWNMSVNSSVTIPLPEDLTSAGQIFFMDAYIRNDLGTFEDSIWRSGAIRFEISNGYIAVIRNSGGYFDGGNYSNTALNRGWLIISYKAP